MTDRQVIVVTCLPRFECISDFKLMGGTVHCEHSLLTGQPVGRWAEMKLWREEEAAVLLLCVRGPRVWEWRQTRVEGSYSLLKALHKSKWLTWRTHDAGILHTCIHTRARTLAHGYANTCVSIHKHICSLSVTHAYVCACTLVQNKAGCLLFAGCGNRFASMPSLSHEGRGIQKEM